MLTWIRQIKILVRKTGFLVRILIQAARKNGFLARITIQGMFHERLAIPRKGFLLVSTEIHPETLAIHLYTLNNLSYSL